MNSFAAIPPNQQPATAPRPASAGTLIHVLVVDDEEAVRVALSRFLRSRGYDAVAVGSGPEALEQLEKGTFELMLCDIRMPGMSGLDVLTQALALNGDLGVVMLTAVNEAETATDALARGAMDYIVKPVGLEELERAVQRVAHRRRLEIERRNVEVIIRDEIASRTDELEREKTALRTLALGIADTLINAMEAKDVYLRGHSQRVADLAASVADSLGLSPDLVENVRLAGRLCDVGKIGIREDVLNKPGPLTPEEFEHVKDHVRIGMEILAPLKHMPDAIEYVSGHHEHFDGSGYPRGLTGEQISMGGRILAACDAFDALTSGRAFREAMSPAETITHLETYVGTKLDPLVFAALSRVVKRRQTLTFIDG
ncbi:MAG: response regulator [Gemmatimonadota bacterium]|nr:response regulator [Gemmatimonadota bacterium]